MTVLRLLADDLTGALDTAAEFAGVAFPLHVFWHGALSDCLPASAGIDTGTREQTMAAACAMVRHLVPELARMHADGGIAYKKVDSLMRGATLAELAACFAAGPWRTCVFAPAFPFQGRVTRGGRQYARSLDGAWEPAGPNLVEALCRAGVPSQRGRLAEPMRAGINVFDADTDADLETIVGHAIQSGEVGAGPVLWCGTGGLARAVAQAFGDGRDATASAILPQPILGLFGSDQAVAAAQLAACDPHWIRLTDADTAGVAGVSARLQAAGIALVSLDLPHGLPRDTATERIAATLHRVCAALPSPPGTLLVAGGETLRGLCLALGATSLALVGRIHPGLPRSILRGGPWDGVAVVSKSGAFGPPDLWRRLLAQNGFFVERTL